MTWRVERGDCVDVMRTLESGSVDAVVCDPPYGLEFMNKDWDRLGASVEQAAEGTDAPHPFRDGAQRVRYGSSAKSMQDWHEVWAREALRVLKPGGHLLAFGGTRTFHRLASGIEDAGFEIRDCIAWMYGCLTDDAEILTEHGWKRGVEVKKGERVATWDAESEAIALAAVEDVIVAPYAGPMRWLMNADTDQVLTPNHRVYHETKPHPHKPWTDTWAVSDARDVTRWAPTRLPVGGFADGPGIGGVAYAELLAFVWTEGGFDRTGTGVRIYQSPSANGTTTKRIDKLIAKLAPAAKRYDRERVYESRTKGSVLSAERCWFFSGEAAERVRADLPAKLPTYELLWRMSLAEKVAFLDAALAGDGSGNAFSQNGREALEWFQTLAHLIGWSARVRMRKNRTTGECNLRRSRTTEMQSRHFKATPDRYYEGDVWCVRVPTGAFVARRNGLVFITGNSGFPKSLNVSVAIDDAAGATREVVGFKQAGMGSGETFGMLQTEGRNGEADHMVPVTAPATPEAERWEGWGTALKPSFEPIVVARKPLAGTVAQTVLKHGTGALNIDGCRVGFASDADRAGAFPGGRVTSSGSPATPQAAQMAERSEFAAERNDSGRWPANVVLDEAAAEQLDEQTGDLTAGRFPGTLNRGALFGGGIRAGGAVNGGALTLEGGGASRFFYTSKVSTAEREAGLADFPAQLEAGTWGGEEHDLTAGKGPTIPRSNLHPTVKPIDLMRWLVRLVTPPDGLVLDPFVGSGSTGCAAVLEGFRFVGIEREVEYAEIAEARIRFWEQHPTDLPIEKAFQSEREKGKRRAAGQEVLF